MNFYTTIADYYDHIFPYNGKQLDFLKSLIQLPKINVLDIGCGTGNLSFELSKSVKCLAAIDFDKKMVETAKRRYVNQKNLHLINLDMRGLREYFLTIRFSFIYCLGNTLVHLDSIEDINTFFFNLKNILNDKGLIVFQILNYDYILDNNITELPLIENEFVKFERYYHYGNKDSLTFHTILTVKSDKLVIENKIPLVPIRKKNIQDILIENGFANIKFYSSFDKTEYKADALPLIFVADAK